jgi:hypothetical protein
MSNEKNTIEANKPEATIDTARLLEEARTFKILVHNGWYVDTMMLPKGIYSGITPNYTSPLQPFRNLLMKQEKWNGGVLT